jgi:HK97 family phage prohead protease
MTNKETRSFSASELRAVENDGKMTLEGRAVPYDTLSQQIGGKSWGFKEKFHKDAFNEHLRTSPDILALAYHDPAKPLARTPNTLKLDNRADGLYFTAELSDTQHSRDLYASVKRGDVTGTSFGFRTLTDSWGIEDGSEVRTVIKAELVEVSPTTFPAYLDTSVAARSREAAKLPATPLRDKILGEILRRFGTE